MHAVQPRFRPFVQFFTEKLKSYAKNKYLWP